MPATPERAFDVRRWLPGLYLVGAIYCLMPFIETLGALWPPHPDSAAWRFGAAGIFLSFAASVPLGLLIATAAARVLEHRLALRLIGVISILVAVLLLMIIGAFALDVVQVRSIIKPNVKGGFDVASVKAAMMGLMIMVTMILLAISSFRAAAGEHGARRTTRRDRAPDLVVGKPSGPVER